MQDVALANDKRKVMSDKKIKRCGTVRCDQRRTRKGGLKIFEECEHASTGESGVEMR